MNDLNDNRKSRAISENKKEVKVISMEYKKNNRELWTNNLRGFKRKNQWENRDVKKKI